MSQAIVYIDRSRVRPGRLADVRSAIQKLAAFIHDREPQLLLYEFFVDQDEERMTVVAVHPDAASLELHLEVGADAFRGFADLIELESIEVYGQPTEAVLGQLRAKGARPRRAWHRGGSFTGRWLRAVRRGTVTVAVACLAGG